MCPLCWLTSWATWLGLGGLVAIIGRCATTAVFRHRARTQQPMIPPGQPRSLEVIDFT